MKVFNLAFVLLFQLPFLCNEALNAPASALTAENTKKPKTNKSDAANIVFRSTDGGQTWQDISQGLPVNSKGGVFFSNENELYFRAGNVMYHSKLNSTVLDWKKAIFPNKQMISPGKSGILAYNYEGQFLQKKNGTSEWRPIYPNFQGKHAHNVFETTGGTVLIGSCKGLYKLTNSGKTWKQVFTGGEIMKLAESNGVLLATGREGILRSTDDGESWNWVISEGGMGVAVENIRGGFAAITFNSQSKTRRVRTSYDGGKTWEPIDAGLPTRVSVSPPWKLFDTHPPVLATTASIIQFGEDLFCGHTIGIFRSSDKGKSWKLILPSVENKVFNLSVSGNVIYAIPRSEGC
jgi:hypothetical protein